MKVVATDKAVYLNKRRRVGDVFDLANPEDFAANWMRKIEDGEAAAHPPPAQPTTLSEMTNIKHATFAEVVNTKKPTKTPAKPDPPLLS